MRVLHIVPLARRAGVQVMFINYLRYIKEQKPKSLDNHIVLAINHFDDIINEIEEIGVKIYKAERRNKYDISILLRIRKIIKENKVDVIYGQNSTGNMWAYFSTFLNPGKRLICHEHGTAWNAKGLNKLITTMWANKAFKTIANSNAAKTILTKKLKVHTNKVQVVYNGVPEVEISKDTNKRWNQLLFVGRLDEVKSPRTLINTMYYLKDKLPNLKLVILGEGPLKMDLISLANDLDVECMVDFRGNVPVNEVLDTMAESSIMLLPSVREPLGNVIIEAAMHKTPTIATYIDGIAEVIEHDETGVLIEPELTSDFPELPMYVVNPENQSLVKPRGINPIKLAKKIEELLKNDEFIAFGERARNEIPKRFNMERYGLEINKILKEK